MMDWLEQQRTRLHGFYRTEYRYSLRITAIAFGALILLGFAVSLLLPDLADQLFLQFAQQMAELGIMDTTGRVDVLALFGISLLAYFAGIVPHGIFELPALILALGSGIYLCRKVTDYVRHNEKGVMGPLMKDLLRLFVMHIIPLLVAAAMMEAYVTPQLLKLFL